MNKKSIAVICIVFIFTASFFAFSMEGYLQIVNSNSVTSLDFNELENSEVKVVKGSTIRIVFEENASTGFVWILDDVYDKNIISLKDDTNVDIKIDDEQFEIVGAPNNRVFVFQTNETGEITLKFTYKRPWVEEDGDFTKIVKIKIVETPEIAPLNYLVANTMGNNVNLEWDYSDEYDYFKIYRRISVGEINFKYLISTVNKYFYDGNFAKEGEVEYGVSAVRNGMESDIKYVKVLLQF